MPLKALFLVDNCYSRNTLIHLHREISKLRRSLRYSGISSCITYTLYVKICLETMRFISARINVCVFDILRLHVCCKFSDFNFSVHFVMMCNFNLNFFVIVLLPTEIK